MTWNGVLCGCLAVKFDSCNNLLSSVHTLLVNSLWYVRLYIKRKYYYYIIIKYNTFVIQYNAIVIQYNTFVIQYNAIVIQYNTLVIHTKQYNCNRIQYNCNTIQLHLITTIMIIMTEHWWRWATVSKELAQNPGATHIWGEGNLL